MKPRKTRLKSPIGCTKYDNIQKGCNISDRVGFMLGQNHHFQWKMTLLKVGDYRRPRVYVGVPLAGAPSKYVHFKTTVWTVNDAVHTWIARLLTDVTAVFTEFSDWLSPSRSPSSWTCSCRRASANRASAYWNVIYLLNLVNRHTFGLKY